MKIIKNFLGYLLLITLTSLVLAVFVMLLWNDVMTSTFNLNEITFWQSFELNLLSGILLKGTNFSLGSAKSNQNSFENVQKPFVKKK